jgi:antitoxin FitA
MGQLVVRNLDDSLKEWLREQAKEHGRSMEQEVREILHSAYRKNGEPAVGLGTAIANIFRGSGITEPIPELRGYKVRAPKFK